LTKYRTARAIAAVVSVLGWVAVATGLFFIVFRLFRGGIALLPASPPLLALATIGLVLVLLGWVARAVFDIADRAYRVTE
jgi:hypothetical protein